MKNILLICSAGVTSALLVEKMEYAAKASNNDLKITSASVSEVKEQIDKADIVLLSPQAAYLEDTVKELVDNSVKIELLSNEIYSSMDGNVIVQLAVKALEK